MEKKKTRKITTSSFYVVYIRHFAISNPQNWEHYSLCLYVYILGCFPLSFACSNRRCCSWHLFIYTQHNTESTLSSPITFYKKKEKNALPPLFLPVYFPFFVSPLLYATRQALSLHFSSYRADRACVLKSLLFVPTVFKLWFVVWFTSREDKTSSLYTYISFFSSGTKWDCPPFFVHIFIFI